MLTPLRPASATATSGKQGYEGQEQVRRYSMPELPEVETIRRGLEKHLVGLTLTNIQVNLPKLFFGDVNNVIGGEVIAVRRFGKGLVIDLSNNDSITIHVKMTGQLIFRKVSPLRQGFEGQAGGENIYPAVNVHISQDKTNDLPNKYTHVIFMFRRQKLGDSSQESVLYFNDIRQFGWIKVVKSAELQDMSFFSKLGKEPLRDLALADFQTILSKAKAPIKQVLMDQAKIAGIGNIYANDALWDAQVHPLRSAYSLTEKEAKALFISIEKVLSLGIAVGGASERDYVNVSGEKGGYQNHFLVYKRTRKPCKRCETLIERIVVVGRGTFICPKCQKN
jgi:formamidopyrimidine-DNA glycosylase